MVVLGVWCVIECELLVLVMLCGWMLLLVLGLFG